MVQYDLSGKWMLKEAGGDTVIDGSLPGCNYLDLMDCNKLPDPFWGRNEETAKKIAENDYEYSRYFDVSTELLESDQVELVISGLDTLATIWLNDSRIAQTDNAHRTYRFAVNEYLKEKDNLIQIHFEATLPYLRNKHKNSPLSTINMGIDGVSHIRKPQCHFGWDWGPILPPCGISGSIGLEGHSLARLGNIRLQQEHKADKVLLTVRSSIETIQDQATKNLTLIYQLISPDQTVQEFKLPFLKAENHFIFQIDKPQLWWSNGLGNQPLYQIKVSIQSEEKTLDSWEGRIGLRTIELNSSPDQWGNNFQFKVNNVPIFGKGADWIPSDSFITRTSPEDLEFYIKSAKEANMNMLRVWGGGYYESDLFYDLCDEYGILIWQDFGFACAPYPFHDTDFLENVRLEVIDNVSRLRHHASLALWCGNNEIELMGMLWKKNKLLYQANQQFFHTQLPEWLSELDEITPYWPGSPNSGSMNSKANSLNMGDTHLWHVWHGMLPIEAFRKLPTRFCSEFGMESLPSMLSIKSFTNEPNLDIFHPTMLAHQKSKGGNQKMLFYLLSKFRNPSNLEDFIYLSQLIQSETIRDATEHWRRNMGHCNGALYWQYNDCWPVASWAGIDYTKQFKAVQYRAKHFNQMCCVSTELTSSHADLYIINEYPVPFAGVLNWKLSDFNGKVITEGEEKVEVAAVQATKIISLNYKSILGKHQKNDVVLVITLSNETGIVSKQTSLLVPDKEAALEKPSIQSVLTIDGNIATLKLTSNTFARYVDVHITDITTPLSDNYFDLEANTPYLINFIVPQQRSMSDLLQELSIRSLVDVKAKGSMKDDLRLRLAMFLRKDNFFSWIIFKFIL